jgi:pimeloyl-ACP methyl ester carboxylesterase
VSDGVETHLVETGDGWILRLQRRAGADGPPVLFVPGYGMNGWVFHNHPTGPSFLEVLRQAGFDGWSVDLRGTSTSRRVRGAPPPRLAAQAAIDLPAVLDHVRRITGAERVHGIGCSLGGSLLYAHAASPDHRLDRLVAIGAPLDWGDTRRRHLLGRLLPVAGRVPMRGTRRFASVGLPVASRLAPALLRVYLNPRITVADRRLTETVEDPMPRINRAIGAWMRAGSLELGGVRIREALGAFDRPLLVLHGSGDGIVPGAAALSVVGATSGPVEVERIDHPSGEAVGHADLFVSDIAPERVFRRTAAFLQ